jgi:hypothetical protein
MASKVQRMQRLTVALSEGFLNMIWEQSYEGKKNNKTVKKMTDDVMKCCREIKDYLDNEGGWISVGEAEKIKKNVNYIRDNHFPDYGENDHRKSFTRMIAISIMIDMIIYQLKFSKGKKRELFDNLYFKVNYFVRYFDKNRKWEDKEDGCLKAAEKLRELMGVQ